MNEKLTMREEVGDFIDKLIKNETVSLISVFESIRAIYYSQPKIVQIHFEIDIKDLLRFYTNELSSYRKDQDIYWRNRHRSEIMCIYSIIFMLIKDLSEIHVFLSSTFLEEYKETEFGTFAYNEQQRDFVFVSKLFPEFVQIATGNEPNITNEN